MAHEVCPVCGDDASIVQRIVRPGIWSLTCSDSRSHPDRRFVLYVAESSRPRAADLRQLVEVPFRRALHVELEMLILRDLESFEWNWGGDGTRQAPCGCLVKFEDDRIWLSTCERHIHGMLNAERRLWQRVMDRGWIVESL